MSLIAARKCVRHSTREAVAQCPSCDGHFCRECVIEHAGMLLCASCLARETALNAPAQASAGRGTGEFVLTVTCVILLWVVFYGFGQFLKAIPAKVHEGTVWRMTGS